MSSIETIPEEVDRIVYPQPSQQRSINRDSWLINPILWLYCIIFGSSTFLFGFDNNIISPLMSLVPFIQKFQGLNSSTNTYVLTARNQNLIVSVPLVGSIIGAWGSSPLQFFLGRKWALLFCYGFSIPALFLQLFAKNLGMFIIGRFWNGVCYGCAMTISPLYLSEVVPRSLRGRSVASQNILTIFSGVIATIVVNATSNIDNHLAYQIPLAVQCGLPALLIPLTLFVPESPLWLVSKSKYDSAHRSLRRLRLSTEEDIDNEIISIQRAIRHEQESSNNVRYLDIFKKSEIKRTIAASGLFSLNQITGIILSTTFSTVFLTQLGYGNPFRFSIAATCCQLAGAILAPFVTDITGRRASLLLGVFILLVIDCIAGGFAFYTNYRQLKLGIAVLTFLFNFFWTLSIYALSMVVPSEVAPVRLRNPVMSYTIGCCQITSVITTFVVPRLTAADAANLGAKTYLVFAGCNIIVLCFIFFLIPETKDRSFIEIDEMYEKHIPAWKTKKFISTLQKLRSMEGDDTIELEKLGPTVQEGI